MRLERSRSTSVEPQLARLFPSQRWQVAPVQSRLAEQIARMTGLDPLLAQVLINRGLETPEQVQQFLEPESLLLPSPLTEFADLGLSVELLLQAIAAQKEIAICGDYDADGMTSTALLLRALRALGARVNYAIPSRMQEGYGLNERIVEEFASSGVQLILTVDNGIAAHRPITRARELGLAVIVTDHHDLPPELPCANAILNPKLLPIASPYAGLAGVGVAYILAVSLAQSLGRTEDLVTALLELFTLGTIADLAPLTGVNRRWVKRGLALLPRSRFAGIQALIQVSGGLTSKQENQAFKPEAIGFRLGPRINAIGRIGDPQTVIDLLTTDDPMLAYAQAMVCEQTNQKRQQLCEEIEREAIAQLEAAQLNLEQERVLVLVHPDWHHGVIGIVASRLVERYGVPVFIGSYEEQGQIRGSARGIPEFDVFAALQYCQDLLLKFGGHRAAGGFSLEADQLAALRSRLRDFAHLQLQPEQLKPLVTVDVEVHLSQITWELYHQIDRLHPCGIGNPEPVFWSAGVEVVEQKRMGKDQAHLKLVLAQTDLDSPQKIQWKATAWRWGRYYPLPTHLDVAYHLQSNTWNGETKLELELIGVRPASTRPANPILRGNRSQGMDVVVEEKLGEQPSLPAAPDQITWFCPEPPSLDQLQPPQWLALEDLATLLPQLQGHLLIYGEQRPYLSVSATPALIAYDRPVQPCEVFILWTLPPSWTHLRWLLAKGQPRQIYVRNSQPQRPTAPELRARLRLHLSKYPDQPLNLLELGQKSWVAPCTIVAALRDMGYACGGFPPTSPLEQELLRLERWYSYPPQELAKLI